MLDSVGTADAAALRAIRQLVPAAIQEVARLVYQAPSELRNDLQAPAAAEMQELLGRLGFRVSVANADGDFCAGVGAFEIALVIRDMDRLPLVIAETAAFLGTDLTAARRLVCRSPAVLVSNVSEATVAAVRERFGKAGADIDVSRSDAARYYAVVAVNSPGIRRTIVDALHGVSRDLSLVEGDAAVVAEDLSLAQVQTLWERLGRTGARVSICNRDFERYDVSLNQAPHTAEIRALLASVGMPDAVVPRVLRNLPVIIQQAVGQAAMQALLDRVAAAGGRATGVPHSFQRFALVLRSVKTPAEAIKVLVTFGDLSETAARDAVRTMKAAPFGSFTRTTALWLQRMLTVQGADVGVELL